MQMNFFQKSTALFGVIVLVVVALGAQSLVQIRDLGTRATEIAQRASLATLSREFWDDFRSVDAVVRRGLSFTDVESVVEAREAFARESAEMRARLEELVTVDGSAEVLELEQAFEDWHALAAPHFASSGLTEVASYDELARARERLASRIDGFATARSNEADGLAATAREAVRASLWQTGIEVALVVAFVVAIAWFGLRYIRRTLGGDPSAVTEMAGRVAAGDLSATLAVPPSDDRSIAAAMNAVQASLARFVREQEAMARAHDGGALDHRMDVAGFAGVYRDMAESINEVVRGHIEVQTRMVDVMSAYARGDFNESMPRLPGERARITEAMDAVRTNLSAINEEIDTLVRAAAAGDFSARGDAERYEHRFHDMVDGLNTLMMTAETGLSEVAKVLASMAEGDLSARASKDFAGAFGRVCEDANRSMDSLTGIVTQITDSSRTVTTASRGIAGNNTDLAARTKQQARSLEDTAASTDQLTATVRENAANATRANEFVREASEVAERGGRVVTEVVETMGGIAASSARIGDFISLIDEIAFQTNILALNAAVEAARAGTEGRGFAVVASEVRNLAQRSAEAAQEIKTLLAESTEKVDSGKALVDEAGRTMAEIVDAVSRVTEIVSGISSASVAQSQDLERVNKAIGQMEEVTRQNMTLVEQSAASAESLEQQAGALSRAVAAFKLAGADGWDGTTERRGPNRATNVTRLPAKGPTALERPAEAAGPA